MWLAVNTGRKKSTKIRHLRMIAQLCTALSSQLRYRQTGKFLNSNTCSTCPHNMANFDPLTAEIASGVCGTAANFNGFRDLPSLLQRRRSPEANQTLQDVWPSPIHFLGLLPSDGILPGAKFTLHPSLAFSYIGSVAERHSSSGRQPDCAAW